MAIDENIFRARLSEKFIALLESERGVQTKLAESIGKKNSFIGEIKRGKPVNALHLKAVEAVFGPQKVLELLSIDDNIAQDNNTIEFPEHTDIIKKFKQKDLARDLNLNALKLEQLNPNALKEINDYIKFKLQHEEKKAGDALKSAANGEKN